MYLVPAAGGVPRRATAGEAAEADPSWSPDGRQLAFGSLSGNQAGTAADRVIQLVDLASGRVTSLPGSQGFFSPRWSPDGRSIVALSVDSSRLVIFDIASQRWSDLVPPGTSYGWPNWSADSTAVTFLRDVFREKLFLRVRIADHKVDTILNGQGANLVFGALGPWFGWMQDGSPMVLLDAGTHDIYALDWDAP